MADQGSGAGDNHGGQRPPEKTFGDVRLGIRAGTRRDGPQRTGGAGSGADPTAVLGATETGASSAAPEAKKGPIVERKGGGVFERVEKARKPSPATKPAEEATTARAAIRRAPEIAAPLEPPPAPELPAPVETESFEQLFAASAANSRSRVGPGQKVSGRILQIGRDTTFLDLGAAAGIKTEALIDSRELRDEHGNYKLKAGDEVVGYVKSIEDGLWITTALPKGAQREALQGARESGMPVEGTVIGVNKGGLEVDLGAGIRGFVPASQASRSFTPDLSSLVGQRLQFLVTQVKDRDIVLSRRALLEREGKEKAEALRDTLVPGTQMEGTVTSLREFGAFVDLGGLEGLIPMAELSHRRVAHPEELLKVGQTVTVEVLRIEAKGAKGGDTRERISLSLKRLEDDPWMVFGNAIVEGQRFKGKVVRLQPFGAFVELAAGVDGLAHVSKLLGPGHGRVTHPEEVLKVGQELWVEVETIDRAARKIGLRPMSAEEAAAPAPPRLGPPRVGDLLEATVDKIESFGLFMRWPGGRGLLPGAELGTPRGADLRKTHAIGTKIKVQITDIDGTNRIRLSATSAQQAQERAEVEEYMKDNRPVGSGFGTLGDLLKKR